MFQQADISFPIYQTMHVPQRIRYSSTRHLFGYGLSDVANPREKCLSFGWAFEKQESVHFFATKGIVSVRHSVSIVVGWVRLSNDSDKWRGWVQRTGRPQRSWTQQPRQSVRHSARVGIWFINQGINPIIPTRTKHGIRLGDKGRCRWAAISQPVNRHQPNKCAGKCHFIAFNKTTYYIFQSENIIRSIFTYNISRKKYLPSIEKPILFIENVAIHLYTHNVKRMQSLVELQHRKLARASP